MEKNSEHESIRSGAIVESPGGGLAVFLRFESADDAKKAAEAADVFAQV